MKQTPISNLIKLSWFQWYDHTPVRQPGDQIIQSWDTASSVSKASDWTVGTTWLKRRNDYYLLHVERDRWEFPEVRRRVISAAQRHTATAVLIEQAGSGSHLIQDLRMSRPNGMPCPIGIVPTGDKADRMDAQTCKIEAGQVYLPRDAPWLSVLLSELLAFPYGRHDDQVDSISQFLNWVSARQARQRISLFGGEVIPLE